jgi:hypothetical protein
MDSFNRTRASEFYRQKIERYGSASAGAECHDEGGISLMRCLVLADLHYSLPQFDWLLSAAPQLVSDIQPLIGPISQCAAGVGRTFRLGEIGVVSLQLGKLRPRTRVSRATIRRYSSNEKK